MNSPVLPITTTNNSPRLSWFSFVEICYICYLWYSMFSVYVGIAVPNLGALWLLGLTVICLPIFNWHGLQKKHLLFVSAIAGFHIIIQIFFYNESLTNGYIIDYFWWPFTVIVISSLMQRPAFLKRLIVNMLLIALIWSPFVVFQDEAGVERATLNVGNVLGNSNTYASWLGYCFLFLWLWSVKINSGVRRSFLRTLAGIALILALRTISRGLIVAIAVAFLASLRKFKLNRTVMVLFTIGTLLFLMVAVSPFFIEVLQSYNIRFFERTARFDVLNIGIKAIAAQPLLGYGVSRLRLVLPITPHNEFLLLWITSGIVPAAIYLIFVIYFVRLAIRYENYEHFINPLPLVIFVILYIPMFNILLPNLWAVSTISYIFAIDDWKKMKS